MASKARRIDDVATTQEDGLNDLSGPPSARPVRLSPENGLAHQELESRPGQPRIRSCCSVLQQFKAPNQLEHNSQEL